MIQVAANGVRAYHPRGPDRYHSLRRDVNFGKKNAAHKISSTKTEATLCYMKWIFGLDRTGTVRHETAIFVNFDFAT